ncbi:MAG: BMP family ABC transporter substrate-binding protein [Chloroflexota bacterium]
MDRTIRAAGALTVACLLLGGTATAVTAATPPLRAALVAAHRFGDHGPMDAFAAGLDRCATDLGFQVTKLESEDPAGYEDDIRAMAADGYDLVLTTFPPMTQATATVAKEFPDTRFRAIYQFVNLPGDAEILPNVESTEYHGNAVAYVLGVLAGSVSKSGHLGAVSGSDDPAINASTNAWAQGVLSVRPDAHVEFGIAESYEDPAKGKEIAAAMVSRGVDVISTEAAKTQLGVIEAAKDAGILVQGDVADNAAMDPTGYAGYVALDYSSDVLLACKELADGTWTGGTHQVLDLTTGTYQVPWDVIDAWAAAQTFTDADTVATALDRAHAAEAAIRDGSLALPFDTSTPVAIGG